MAVTQWLIALSTLSFAGVGTSRCGIEKSFESRSTKGVHTDKSHVVTNGTKGRADMDEQSEWCGKVLAGFLRQASTVLNRSVEEHTESVDGNKLTLKYGSVFGFYDTRLLTAKVKRGRTTNELTAVVEVPWLELRSFNCFETETYDEALWLHLVVTAKNARYRLGLCYDVTGTEVFASYYIDMDTALVTIKEKDVDRYVFPITRLARDTFDALVKEAMPEALAEAMNDSALLDAFDRAGCL